MIHSFIIEAVHIPGHSNEIADALSLFHFQAFRHLCPAANVDPTPCPIRNSFGLNASFSNLINSARYYITKGLATSTLKAYSSAWSLFIMFCCAYQISLFPILVPTVCTFLVHIFQSRNLKIFTIRKLLTGISCQISQS